MSVTEARTTATRTTTRPATRDDRDRVNRTLARAFADDPVFAWLMPDEANRLPRLPEVFDIFAEAFARHDETHTIGAVEGVAMWAPPGVSPVHPDDEEAMGERVAAVAGDDLERIGICMAVFEEAHPEEPAWYLQFLGVDPSRQGQGLGSALLRDVLDRADAAGEAAYLEATSELNRALYERHGFEVVRGLVLPDGPPVYAMWREPQAG
jgi:ribosomal protein S18 acetylase RimI-like enzyme